MQQNIEQLKEIYLEKFSNQGTRAHVAQVIKTFGDEISIEQIEKVIKMWEKTLEPRTTRTRITILKKYITYIAKKLKRVDLLEYEFPKIKIPQKARFIWNTVEVERIKHYLKTYDNSKGIATLATFLLNNGCRIAEAMAVLSQPKEFKQRGDGLHYTIMAAFKKNNARAYILKPTEWEEYNNVIKNNPKTFSNLNVLTYEMKKLFKQLKDEFPEWKKADITFHTFRRTWITNQHEAGYDIVSIQKSTGHKDTTTLINSYILPSEETLVRYVERASDEKRLKQKSIEELKKEVNALRDFKDSAIINEKMQLNELEAIRLKNEALKLENERLKRIIKELKPTEKEGF
ncbi:tyrosine-type recombinase/integrase [Mycoplasma seminis]|uniref:Tyrosine-type recombinase/integrase n=1 Tax=Mycoplasma seminis TaxID=512749 RepID=A0ABY9HA05_9MOLU|nr:tyrosine-type recombinase/integrase [Mycoplasma seminis]WLP85251.1 tyrosine-type recombinase/integrase [Mycoplasma seminis]